MNKDEILKRIHEEWLALILRGDTPQQTARVKEMTARGNRQ